MNELSDAMVRGLEVIDGGFGLPALRTRDRGVNFTVAKNLVAADLATYRLFHGDQQLLTLTDKGREALAAHRAGR